MTDQEYLDLQQELSEREAHKPGCAKCEFLSYGQLSGMYTFSLKANIHGPKDDGWVDEPHRSGMVRYCSSCLANPAPNFNWIAKIPFDKFKQFQINNHRLAYALEDMRPLLDPDPVQGPVEQDNGGFKFF